jgi:hypothetical protein
MILYTQTWRERLVINYVLGQGNQWSISQARGEALSAWKYRTLPYGSTRITAGSNPAFLKSNKVTNKSEIVYHKNLSSFFYGSEQRDEEVSYPRWLSCFHKRLIKILGLAVCFAFCSIIGNICSNSLALEICSENYDQRQHRSRWKKNYRWLNYWQY